MSLQDDFSSKLKRVFIQLHNYSYYHGPSDDKQPDSRFIGRKRQKEKLRSILTDTEKNSGTYLIAGYRGMGKTSFVNKVIESIYTPITLFSRLIYFIFLHLVIFTISTFVFFDLNKDNSIFQLDMHLLYSRLFFAVFVLAGIAYIFMKFSTRYILKKIYSRKHLQWSEWFVLFIINISFILFIFFESDKNLHYKTIQKTYFQSLLILLGFIGCVRLVIPLFKQNSIHEKTKSLFSYLIEKIRQFINFSDRINIKLNLGHSNLQEIDILRLIARNIYISYKKYRRTYTYNWFVRAFFIFVIFIFARISWGLYSTNQSYYSLLQNSGVSTAFPSQQRLFLERDSLLMFTYNELQKNNQTSISEYLSNTHFLNFRCNTNVDTSIIKAYIKTNEANNIGTIEKFYEPYQFPAKLKKKIKAFQNLKFGEEKVLVVTCYLDYALFIGYSYLIDFTYLNKARILPDNLHYFFFIYFVLLLFLFRLFSRIAFQNKTSRIQVIKNLRFLNELIDSHVSKETSTGIGFIQSRQHIFSKNKSLKYERADVREIEKRLIEIIEDINELPIYSFRAKFTIVFDELDKIESYIDPQDKKERHANGESQTPESIRKRLQTVMELLSNLKYFLSTAQAKFIFIAGRELYDASLADVTDRNFRLGSIFHDVIYLNSFFTDLDSFGSEDITSRTEQYICRFLFPVNHVVNTPTLKEYNKYLIKNFPEFNEAKQKDKTQKMIARQKREKIIYLLQQFIVYLNHISAGAPSKITTYFENYITTPNAIYNYNKKSGLFVGSEKGTHFLFFDFYHQYKIGVFDYLLTPFNFSINKVIKNYGDKLIISASFLHDHLLKFHRNAFSWRDLEATPEMIDVNKNPELRDFLGIVMDYMLKTHIQEILNGLYDFKFPKKVSQEINYLSHVSEEASAIFNFTLDESLAIKQHFLNKLTKLDKEDSNGDDLLNQYQFARSSIYLTIGDLCFYDEDLGDAMVNYLEAINSIRNLEVEKLSITQMAILTRNMLKLGHTLEKRRTYDVAYLTYNEIWEKICGLLKHRYNYWDNNLELKDALDNIKYFYQPLLAKLHLTEKTSLDGINSNDLQSLEEEFCKIYNLIRTKDKHNIYVEFWNKAGDILYYKYATKCDCNNDESQSLICNPRENKMKCFACKYYLDGLNKLIYQHIHIEDMYYPQNLKLFIENQYQNINQHESKVLAMTLSDLGDVFLGCSNKKDDTIATSLFTKLTNDFSDNENAELLVNIETGNRLEKMLINYHLSAIFYRKSGDDKNFAFQFTKILYFIKEYTKKRDIQTNPAKNIIQKYIETISLQSIASIYKAYDHIHAIEVSRFKNIFNSDDTYLIPKEVSLNMGSINAEIDEIVMLYQKINLRLSKTIENIYCPLSPYSINNNMYNRFLKLKLKAEMNKKYFDQILDFKRSHDVFDYLFENPCNKKATEEIIQIYISKINDKEAQYKIYNKETTAQDAIEFCITDSIFCYFEMLKIFNTFGVSFHLNYSTLAEIHEKLYIWSELYDFYCIMGTYYNISEIQDIHKKENKLQGTPKSIQHYEKIAYELIDLDKNTSIVNKLKNLIEPDNLPSIIAVYHCEKAVQANQLAIETHREGKSYRDLLENMYYLNDDYNDKLYHFSVALERYKLNLYSNESEERITKLKSRMSKSSIYNADHYLKTFI